MAKASGVHQADQKLIELSQANMCESSSSLSVSDVRQPNALVVVKFYTQYLEDIGIDVPFITDHPAYQNMQHPDIHHAMLQYGMLAKAMQFFLSKINSGLSFTIADIITPSPNRHRMFLGELLNCHSYAAQVQPQVQTAFSNWKNREERISKLRDEMEGQQNQKSQLLHDKGVREEKVKDFEKRMQFGNQQCNRLSSEMAEHRQRVIELQQELEENCQKHQQLLQSKELHTSKLKQLENQIVNSPQRFKQDLSVVQTSMNTLKSEVTEREAILTTRQQMEKHLTEYLQVLKDVRDLANLVGDLKKTSMRTTTRINELMSERLKLSTANDKLAKEKINVVDRYNKLQEKSSSISQSQNRKINEMSNTLRSYESEEQNMLDLLEATDQAIRNYDVEKNELQCILQDSASYESMAVQLLNELHAIGTERVFDEANAILFEKFEQLKEDFECKKR